MLVQGRGMVGSEEEGGSKFSEQLGDLEIPTKVPAGSWINGFAVQERISGWMPYKFYSLFKFI